MSTQADPIVSNWYSHLDKGQEFRIVAFDEDSALVEIQYFDGDLEELDLEAWYQLDIEPAEAPENWSGPLDIGEQDDLGTSVTDTTASDWAAPLQDQHLSNATPGQTVANVTEDDWGQGQPEEEPVEGEQ